MRKLLLMCLFCIGISTITLAQTAPTPADKAAGLKTALSLNDDQTAKVLTIYANQDKSMDSLKKNESGGYGAMMKKMVPIITNTNDKIKAILTPEQAATFQIKVDAQNAAIKKMMDSTPPSN